MSLGSLRFQPSNLSGRVDRRLLSASVVLLIVVPLTWVPIMNDITTGRTAESQVPLPQETLEEQPYLRLISRDTRPDSENLISEAQPAHGILEPAQVELTGYAASGEISARTDTYENLDYNLPLDVDHDWVADIAEVSLWNLEKVYAVNGSFSEGFPGTNVNPSGGVDYYPLGWDASSTDTTTYDDDVQIAGYDSSGERYTMVESQGGKVGQNAFGHAAGTRVFWMQAVQNTPYTEDFILSFSYFYLRGPLDKNPAYPISGNCSITVSIDGSAIWKMSLLTLLQRGVWKESGQIPITVSGAPGSFTFEIGLEIDESLVLDKRNDYDNDGIADGIGNAAYITVFLDDVSFLKATPPTAAEVELSFTVGEETQPLAGTSGFYTASIVNSSYWTSSHVSVSLVANTSVSFTYKTRLLSHRFSNSSWRNDISSHGVSFSIRPESSSELTFYTYLGYLGGYEEPMMSIRFPVDWENATVFDPFLTDLTASCTTADGLIEVPSSLMNRLGWWEIRLQSPNYAKSIFSEVYDSELDTWVPMSVFRIGNKTRAVVSIGTVTASPPIAGANVTWHMPSGVLWASELVSGSGIIHGIAHEFGVMNSSAGVWTMRIFWTNGTEVARGEALFEVHHRAELIADPDVISTYAGLTVTGLVRYRDAETGLYLMDEAASMIGSWSGGLVVFEPNPVRNWWEGQLDTSLVEAGVHLVNVTVVRQYYDNASCQIAIDSYYDTRLSSPNSPWTSVQWGQVAELTFFFEMYDYSAASWLPIDDASGLDILVNWTNGYWSSANDPSPGIYTIDIDTSVMPAGTYLLNVTFTKESYETGAIWLTLIVSPMTSSLTIAGSGSARVDIDESYVVTVTYLDQFANPIPSASVVVDEITPASGLEHTTPAAVVGEPGNYSLQLTPRDAGVFTVRLVASSDNAQPASTVFVLVVNDLNTRLEIQNSGSVEIGLTDTYNATFRYEMLNGTGINGASVQIVYTGPSASLSWDLAQGVSGDYSVEFSAGQSGTYLITIAASKQYYQSASDAFFLIVRDISTEISVLNGTADLVSFGRTYRLLVQYTNGSGFGLDDADVTIQSVTPASGLSWSNTTKLGSGLFEIMLKPETADTFTMTIQASYLNHQTKFSIFTITATAIATSFGVLNTSTSISFDQNFTVYLRYQMDNGTGLEDAVLSVQNPPTGVSISAFQDLGGGYYRVTLTPTQVGVYDLIFRADLAGYQSGTAGFTLGATRIATTMRTQSGQTTDAMVYGDEYSFLLIYERSDGILENVTEAIIDIQVSPATGLTAMYTEQDSGYEIQITADRVGRWTLSITAEKEGYALSFVQVVIDVEPILVDVEVLSRLSGVEGQSSELTVRLTNRHTDEPLIGATVGYRLTMTGGGDYLPLQETGTPGVYTAQHALGVYPGGAMLTLQIRLSMDNYELFEGVFSATFFVDQDPWLVMRPAVTYGGSSAGLLVVLAVGYKIRNKRIKRKNLAALQVKKRFDDVSNILGVIVLHKKTGLPIYSKILRGGFDEAMVSAFVTAITHFRSEFGMDEKHWDFNVIPISDIISAVPTRNLIVAFITVRPPSQYQEISMEAFGRATGAMFDETMADVRSNVIDSEHRGMFDNLFYDLMDGFLLDNFHVNMEASFPKGMDCLQSTATQLENGEGFKLEDLAKGMATCGVEESYAYKMVMDAIERQLIRTANGEDIGGVVQPFIDREKSERDEVTSDLSD